MRGRLRRELLPLLRDMYGDGVGGRLGRVAAESAGAAELVHRHALQALREAGRVGTGGGGAWVECGGLEEQGAAWWTAALRAVCRRAGLASVGCALGEMGWVGRWGWAGRKWGRILGRWWRRQQQQQEQHHSSSSSSSSATLNQ